MSDLVEALKVTPEEVMIVAEMTVGHYGWMHGSGRSRLVTLGELQTGRPKTILHHFLSCYLVTMDMDLTCNQVGD